MQITKIVIPVLLNILTFAFEAISNGAVQAEPESRQIFHIARTLHPTSTQTGQKKISLNLNFSKPDQQQKLIILKEPAN